MFFVLLIVAWVRYQRKMVEIQEKKYNGVVLWMMLYWMLFLRQVIIGGRVNGTFTFKAFDDIVKELVENFLMEINKDKVKNQQKTLKKNFHECYDIFKDGLNGFGWNDSLNI